MTAYECFVCGAAAKEGNFYCAIDVVRGKHDPDDVSTSERWRIHFCDECFKKEWIVVSNEYVVTQGRRIPAPGT